MYSIGQVSARSGVNIETIRYYERKGILPAPARTQSGRRQYDRDDLSRLRFVRKCRDLGFSMSDAKALLGLAISGGMNCGEAKPIAQAHLDAVVKKMAELARLREALRSLVDACREPSSECPMLGLIFEVSDIPA
ncbi:MAG: helix-turn-helix domain-containing protein [Rhizobiaceae bacterium]|nr:helix-turn-helix domain-containing protein [Rhizobiaceae bacterium]